MSSVYICDGHCLYCVNWHFKVGHNHVGSFHSPKADIIHVVFSYSHIANVIVCYVYMNATKVFGVGYVSLITQSEPVCVKCMGPCWTNTYQWVQLDFYIYVHVHAYNLATTQLRGNEKEISYWWCNQVTALPHQNGFSSYQISHWVHRHMQMPKYRCWLTQAVEIKGEMRQANFPLWSLDQVHQRLRHNQQKTRSCLLIPTYLQ